MRAALAARPPALVSVGARERHAAVLLPLVPATTLAEMALVFLVRPSSMPTHAGQVAFPGGGLEPGEDPVLGALREADEELGVPRDRVEVLGRLDDLRTHTGFVVSPIVAVLPHALELVPSAREVDQVFAVPIGVLGDPRGRRTMRGRRTRGGHEGPLHFWVDVPHVIWGATGHILDGFLARLDEAGRHRSA